MKWNGKKDKSFKNPLAFIGKGVTFDTGGIRSNRLVHGGHEMGYG